MKHSQQAMGENFKTFHSGINHLKLPWELPTGMGGQVLSELELLMAYSQEGE